jgi:hypothetical protein
MRARETGSDACVIIDAHLYAPRAHAPLPGVMSITALVSNSCNLGPELGCAQPSVRVVDMLARDLAHPSHATLHTPVTWQEYDQSTTRRRATRTYTHKNLHKHTFRNRPACRKGFKWITLQRSKSKKQPYDNRHGSHDRPLLASQQRNKDIKWIALQHKTAEFSRV